MADEAEIRDLLTSYFSKYNFTRHQIESFDHYLLDLVPSIVNENNRIVVISRRNSMTHVIHFGNVTITKPTYRDSSGAHRRLTPYEARTMALTYSSQVLVNVTHEIYTNDQAVVEANVSNVQENQQYQDDEVVSFGNMVASNTFYEIPLFEMPIMVGSALCYTQEEPDTRMTRECLYDPGGYFIINGNEKVMLAQEKMRHNFPYVSASNQGNTKLVCEVRSWNEKKIRSTSTLYVYLLQNAGSSMPEIVLMLPFINYAIPLPTVFRLIGVEATGEMARFITGRSEIDQSQIDGSGTDSNGGLSARDYHMEHAVRCVLRDPYADMSIDDLCEMIGQQGTNEKTQERRIRSVKHIFHNEFLPHMGLERTPETLRKRAFYLGYIIRKLLRVYLDREPPDDRDDYANKRLETTGMLLALMLRQLLRMYLRSVKSTLQRAADNGKYINITDTLTPKRISSGFKYALSTGNWGTQKGGSNQTGVAQVLTRTTVLSAIAHLRRLNTPVNRQGKTPEPRQLHRTHKGLVCPCETPEGTGCGLITNLAVMTHVRIGYPIDNIIFVVMSVKRENDTGVLVPALVPLLECSPEMTVAEENCLVFVNGTLIGISEDPETLHQDLKRLRKHRDLPFDISITYLRRRREIMINGDEGACMRPVFVASELPHFQSVYSQNKDDMYLLWDAMMSEGLIEYVDKEEESSLRVAQRLSDTGSGDGEETESRPSDYTHAEIYPSLMLGLCASLIPFAEHNQAPRNMYQAGMAKQSLGVPSSNFQYRYDTKTHVLSYPQKPLTTTMISRLVDYDEMPAGQNVVVAIACWTGFNQEDSLVMKKSFIERGGFHSTCFQTYRDSEKQSGADKETIQKPNAEEVTGMREGNHSKIGEDGLPTPGTQLELNDAVIGKVMTTGALQKQSRDDIIKRDRSVLQEDDEPSIVDQVLVASSLLKEDCLTVRVRTRAVRVPIVGDKFSSRHGQKGVIGLILPEEDMPFTTQGITPDIIINPHCLPSRMTLAHLMEMHASVPGAINGKFVDGTSFRYTSVDQIAQDLKQHGMHPYCENVMYDGRRGEMLKGTIFMGLIFYQRLRHMACDKMHARSRGPVQFLNRQPAEGRSRRGGLRIGEMERDTFISHAASEIAADRLFQQSDYWETVVCRECGFIAEKMGRDNRQKLYSHVLNVKNLYFCRFCKSNSNVVPVSMPYAFFLLVRELEACHIAVRIRVDQDTKQCRLEPCV